MPLNIILVSALTSTVNPELTQLASFPVKNKIANISILLDRMEDMTIKVEIKSTTLKDFLKSKDFVKIFGSIKEEEVVFDDTTNNIYVNKQVLNKTYNIDGQTDNKSINNNNTIMGTFLFDNEQEGIQFFFTDLDFCDYVTNNFNKSYVICQDVSKSVRFKNPFNIELINDVKFAFRNFAVFDMNYSKISEKNLFNKKRLLQKNVNKYNDAIYNSSDMYLPSYIESKPSNNNIFTLFKTIKYAFTTNQLKSIPSDHILTLEQQDADILHTPFRLTGDSAFEIMRFATKDTLSNKFFPESEMKGLSQLEKIGRELTLEEKLNQHFIQYASEDFPIPGGPDGSTPSCEFFMLGENNLANNRLVIPVFGTLHHINLFLTKMLKDNVRFIQPLDQIDIIVKKVGGNMFYNYGLRETKISALPVLNLVQELIKNLDISNNEMISFPNEIGIEKKIINFNHTTKKTVKLVRLLNKDFNTFFIKGVL